MVKSTKKLVLAALMAAFTYIATTIIKIQTPTFGYIHIGDSFVLLSGIVLGPITGGLAAGIGSMFSDIFSGYASWAPATFIIKTFTAAVAGLLFHKWKPAHSSPIARNICVLISGCIGEFLMVIGYFLYEIAITAFASGGFTTVAIASGITVSAAGIPFNIVQGIVGIFICLLLLPVLLKIEDIRDWILH